ncbi:unnamed protein product [Brassica oleracea]|uniref:(rape) hypothetical protein n=1 Tax=Brassica napus TaxID=3708 RepID=A0A816J293_BRANA|nr:unnamed protein product [Brassica napus]
MFSPMLAILLKVGVSIGCSAATARAELMTMMTWIFLVTRLRRKRKLQRRGRLLRSPKRVDSHMCSWK